MKGMQGLVVAGMLGLLGVALNWIYLQGKSQQIRTVSFLGIRSGVELKPGQMFQEAHFAPVTVPEKNVGDLKGFVYLYKDRKTIVGLTATRQYKEGDLIYREHNRRPPPELKLGPDEKLIWVSANSNSFVPDLVDPGDTIEFVVPVYDDPALSPAPSPTPDEAGFAVAAARQAVRTEIIGPFCVGSLGNRLASESVARGNRMSTSQERLVGIIVSKSNPQELQNAERLQARILSGDYQNIGVNLLEKVRLQR